MPRVPVLLQPPAGRTAGRARRQVDLLDQLGFDCFWAGNAGQLWRLTGCWHDSYYAGRAWSNVACANRRERELLEAMTATATLHDASWDIPPAQ